MGKTIEVTKVDGKDIVVKRDGKNVEGLSATCTHRGCTIAYNANEKTLDCPCHGSRYDLDGNVLNGPAQTPLAPVEVKEEDGNLHLG